MPRSKLRYYLCAYGHVCRTSHALDATEAALYCFGVTTRVTTIDIGPRRITSAKQLKPYQDRLAERHWALTGGKLFDGTWLPPDDFPVLRTADDLRQIATMKGKALNPFTCHTGGGHQFNVYTIVGETTQYVFRKDGDRGFVGFDYRWPA